MPIIVKINNRLTEEVRKYFNGERGRPTLLTKYGNAKASLLQLLC